MRTTERKNLNGSVVRYLALAHNQRVDGTTKTNVLLNLGREDRLDRDGLRRLVRSINRYLGEPDTDAGTDAAAVTGTDAATDGLRLISSRPAGAAWLLHGLWTTLEVDTALRKVLGGRRFSTDVERVLFALVANRAIDPSSTLAAAEWASHDVAIPGLDGMDEDHAYRAMDLLVEADTDASVQEAVFFAVADLLNLEVDLLFFDTTSTYFERDTEDPDGENATPGFRRYGHSKDHRRDLPQIVIGLAVTREGIPVRCWCWPGNTSDQAILPEVRDGLRGWRLGRVVTVVERGFRDLKSTIELRPVFHRLEPRIRAHVLLCWLALLLIRVAERRTGQTWRQINRELGRLHAITLTGPAGTVVQTTEPTTAQSSILRACGLTPPPRITTLHPA
ncbi:IS1634 family transposase [Pseudonocardia hydrocarbonoxydans]|uniref:IS1634 family transposase n=1 Tax=Pseudonocardia hydrocarbonoxydans TaxID=76726 RepID=UPI0031D5A358